MNQSHLKRAILWIGRLLITLFKFWLKSPQSTPAILAFMVHRLYHIPKFLDRNVHVEKHTSNFSNEIKYIVKLYKKAGADFNPSSQASYKQLEPQVNNRYALLYFLVSKLKPKVIVETGVAAGISTGFILQAIKDNGFGKLYSIDLPFQWYTYGAFKLHLDSLPAGKMPGYLVPEDLKENWELIIGDTYKKLPELLTKLKHIDLFFHDSEHTYTTMTFEYEKAWPYIESKGLLITDDVDFTTAFNDFGNHKKTVPIYFNQLGIIQKK